EVGSGRSLTVSTGNNHLLSSTPVHNHGTVLWSGGAIFLQNSTAVTNESDGVWEAQADLVLTSSSCGAPSFANAGTMRKTAGAGTLTLGGCVTYANTGTVDVQSGSLQVGGPATFANSGHLTVAATTTFFLDRETTRPESSYGWTGSAFLSGRNTVTYDVRRT